MAVFMLNNFLRPLLRDKPPPRIMLLRLSPILFGLLFILPLAIFIRGQQPPSAVSGTHVTAPIEAQDTIKPGQTGIGNLAMGEQHGWSIHGTKGQRLAVTLNADWDSHLAFYMPDGVQTLTTDGFSAGNGRAWIDGVTLPLDGTYTIVVSGENGGGGAYQLRLSEPDPAQPPIVHKVGTDGVLITN